MPEPSGTFGRKRVLLQLCLGFASGLPLLLTGSTLTTWMTSVGVDLKTVGIFALVGLPYSFKFTWAPLLDRFRLPLLGRRRGWLLLFQLLLIAALALLGASDPTHHLRGLAAAALVVAFFAASQDIVTDAYRTDLLAPDERAAGTVTFVFGYRIGVLVAGALALILSERMSWRSVYLLMAACMLVGVVTTILAPEPSGESRPPRTLLDAVVHPFRDLFSRPGVAAILAFVVAFVPTSPGLPPYPAMPSAEDPYVGIPNNIVALLGGLAAGFATYGLIIGLRNALQPPAESDRDSPLDRTVQTCATQLQRLADAHPPTRWILPAVSALYLLIGGVLLLFWDRPYRDWVHVYAAVGMFGGIVLVALYYAVHAASNNDTMRARVGFAGAYTAIAVAMGALIVYIAARIFLTHEGVNVFWAEVAVIVLFTLFWFIQTLDLWDEEDKYRDAGPV